MSFNIGWFKFYRKFIDFEWYKHSPTKSLYLHCLLKANYKELKFMGSIIPAGSFVTSYRNLANELGLTVQQTRTALTNLKSTHNITIKTTNKYTVINVVDWAKYQCEESDINTVNNKPTTNHQQTNNKQTTLSKEYKNIRSKEIKNKDIKTYVSFTKKDAKEMLKDFAKDDKLLYEKLCDFYDMRIAIKKPMTKAALKLLLNKLVKLTKESKGIHPSEFLEQSIINSWAGIFPIKKDYVSKYSNKQNKKDVSIEWLEEYL